MTQINKIKELCNFLGTKDKVRALQLVEKRQFQALQELVDSVLDIIEINKSKEIPNMEIVSLNETNILELSFLILKYREQLIEEDD